MPVPWVSRPTLVWGWRSRGWLNVTEMVLDWKRALSPKEFSEWRLGFCCFSRGHCFELRFIQFEAEKGRFIAVLRCFKGVEISQLIDFIGLIPILRGTAWFRPIFGVTY